MQVNHEENRRNYYFELRKKNIRRLIGNDYILKNDYNSMETVIEIECRNCHEIFKLKYSQFIAYFRRRVILNKEKKGEFSGCSSCNNNRIKKGDKRVEFCVKEEEFLKILENELNGDFEMIGEYKAYSKRTFFRHKRCGGIFAIRPTELRKLKRCRKCKMYLK